MSTNTKELKCALLKNFLDNFSNKQHCYFRAHKKTRSVVERRAWSLLKRRFCVLHGEIRVTPPAKVCQIIEVYARKEIFKCQLKRTSCWKRMTHSQWNSNHNVLLNGHVRVFSTEMSLYTFISSKSQHLQYFDPSCYDYCHICSYHCKCMYIYSVNYIFGDVSHDF